MREEMLVIENGRISYTGNDILRELYLQMFKGEIFGIIFSNILEKKCLLDFIKGKTALDSGRIYLNGEKIDVRESTRLLPSLTAVIERTSKLINSLSIEENVLIFAQFMEKYITDDRKYTHAMERVKKELHVDIRTDKSVAALTAKEKVIIELMKAYVEDKKLVVIADAAGFLNSVELAEVFSLINRLRESGMTFVIIESFEGIVFKWTDRQAIIKNGKTLGIYKSRDIKRQQIYSALIGDQYKKQANGIVTVRKNEQEMQKPALVFEGINTEVLNDFNFSINKGEVVTVYYMDDPSFSHIVDLLRGKRKPSSGHIIVSGKEYMVNDTHKAVKKGVCFVEESPYENMLFYDMSILDNLCLALAGKVPFLWLRKRFTKSVQELASGYMGDDIINMKLSALPPVKLQQIVYLKWLLYAPSVVVCIKPFVEVDVHLREVTVNMIEMLRMRGIAVIVFTSNFSETYQIDGKTVYIRNGRLIDEDEVYKILYNEG